MVYRESPSEFWEDVRRAADIPVNPSRWKIVIKRKPLIDEEEIKGGKRVRKRLSVNRRARG